MHGKFTKSHFYENFYPLKSGILELTKLFVPDVQLQGQFYCIFQVQKQLQERT